MVRHISGLSELVSLYDALLCDVWGVIHDGRRSFPAACDALARWRETAGPVVLISNSPRPSRDVAEQLRELGVPDESWTSIVTSGDATRALLAERSPGPAWMIGPPRDRSLYEGLGLIFGDLEESAFIACSGPRDDEIETPEDYRAELTRAAARGMPMICANPDRVVQRGDRLIYCGGALADLYAALGGTVFMAGKPHSPIYDLSLAAIGTDLDRPVDIGRVLAIGDGVATDILGANGQGLDVIFIAGGIHRAEAIGPNDGLDPSSLSALLSEARAHANYLAPALSW